MKRELIAQMTRIRELILAGKAAVRLGLKSTNFKPQTLAGNYQLEKQIMMRTKKLQLKSPISPLILTLHKVSIINWVETLYGG